MSDSTLRELLAPIVRDVLREELPRLLCQVLDEREDAAASSDDVLDPHALAKLACCSLSTARAMLRRVPGHFCLASSSGGHRALWRVRRRDAIAFLQRREVRP